MTIHSLIILLLSNSVSLRKDQSILYSRSVLISFSLPIYLIVKSFYSIFFASDTGIGIYGGLFFVSAITHTFHLIIYIISSIILILTGFYPSISLNRPFEKKGWANKESELIKNSSVNELNATKNNKELAAVEEENLKESDLLSYKAQMFKIIEYPLIISFIVTGAVFVISTNDLISMFVSIELQSYGLYLLSTIYKDSELSTSGGLMYFLLGGLSSCFILLGAALLYANSGTTNLDNIHVINDISNVCMLSNGDLNSINNNILDIMISGNTSLADSQSNHQTNLIYNSYYIIISLIFITVGFLFKVSAAPFHFWSPDVYDSIPTIVTTFVAIIAKISIFIFLSGQIVNNFVGSSQGLDTISTYTNYNPLIGSNLLISSLLSLIIGTVLGLTQSRIKRLFAYSTISHVGFILLGIAINSVESIQAFLFYIIQYSFTNLNAFLLLVCVGYSYHYYENKNNENMTDKNNSPIQLINQLKGYFYINPMLSLSLCITLFSFTGIPPLLGFFGKMMILSAAIDKGYIFMCLLAILTSVISAGYYLYIIKQMYFYKTDYIKNFNISSPNYELGMHGDYASLKLSAVTNPDKIEKYLEEKEPKLVLSNYLSISISILTLLILLFILNPNESLNLTCLLALLFF